MKFCPECGFKFDKDYKFCPECGYKLDEAVSEQKTTTKKKDDLFDFSNDTLDAAFEKQLQKTEVKVEKKEENSQEKKKRKLNALDLFDDGQYASAFPLLLEFAEEDDGESAYYVSECYRYGYGTDKNINKAERWLERSIDLKFNKAANRKEALIMEARNTALELERKRLEAKKLEEEMKKAELLAKEKEEALELERKRAEQLAKERAEALELERKKAEQLAKEKQEKERLERKKAEEEKLAKEKAEAERIAREKQQVILDEKKRKAARECYENNIEKSFDLCYYFAQKGEVEFQANIGYLYYCGIGIEKNLSKAVYWFEKAAKQGDIDSQYNLGYCYHRGLGVAEDDEKAKYWYTKAAEAGSVVAEYGLGTLLYYNYGDYKNAAYWFEKASNQGHKDAKKMLKQALKSAKNMPGWF